MVGRDKENRLFQITAYSGVASFVCIGILLSISSIAWISISTALSIIVALGLSGYCVLHFFKVAWVYLQKYRRDAAREARILQARETPPPPAATPAPKVPSGAVSAAQAFQKLAFKSFNTTHESL